MPLARDRNVPDAGELAPRVGRHIVAPSVVVVILSVRSTKHVNLVLVSDAGMAGTLRGRVGGRLDELPRRRALEAVQIKAP